MAKAAKRAFVCNECGADYPRWQGQCSACQAWNSITEIRLAASPTVARNERLTGYAGDAGVSRVQKLSDISLDELPRFSTGFKEFDRVLGGGVVPGSAILIGGNPGAGKSTLLLQILCHLSENMKTLYVTGEESLQQVAMRAHRLGLPTANMNMLSETSIEQICEIADKEQPKLMVIDSIQVMHMADIQSSPGRLRRCVKRRLTSPVSLKRAAWRLSWSAMSLKTVHWRGRKCSSTVSTVPCCSTAMLIRVSVRCAATKTALVP